LVVRIGVDIRCDGDCPQRLADGNRVHQVAIVSHFCARQTKSVLNRRSDRPRDQLRAGASCINWEVFTFRQARHRDLPKPKAEAIEPALDADGGDRKIANGGIINSFDPAIPRNNAPRHYRIFAPHPPCNR